MLSPCGSVPPRQVYFLAEIEFVSVERVAAYEHLESEEKTRGAVSLKVVRRDESYAAAGGVGVGVGKAAQGQVGKREVDGKGRERKAAAEEEVQGQRQANAVAVKARGVQMRYGPEGGLTLTGLNLTVQAGEKVAIVGRTAAGKSSVFQLLLGFYGYESGSLAIEGVEVAAMPCCR